MKTFINFYLPSLAIVGLLFLSCSKDDVPAPPPQDACDNKSIIMLSTDYNNNPSTGIEYIGYDLNSPIQGPGMPVGSHANTSNLKLIMPPNSSIYSKSDKLHGVIINEVYYSFDLNNFTTTENTIAPEMVAPVISGNNAYIIEMVTPYPNMGESASFEIREFSPLNGNIGNALPISANEKSFVNNSSFHREIISSASNGSDELYFIGATNLLIVNTSSNTASHVDLYPSFTWDNWMTFQGLEYSESLGLLATRKNSINQFDIVQIDPHSGTFTELVTIPGNLNTEFYSTTYNECTKTFYITTLNTSDWSADYYEINLNNNSISNTQNFSNYTYGLEVIDN